MRAHIRVDSPSSTSPVLPPPLALTMVAKITIGSGADMPELPLLPGSYDDDVVVSVIGNPADGDAQNVTVGYSLAPAWLDRLIPSADFLPHSEAKEGQGPLGCVGH